MKKTFLLQMLFLLLPMLSAAHTINYQLDPMNDGEVISKYLQLGFTHILPNGFDHVLFILCVFFLNKDLKKIMLQATLFSLAHSITLALAVYDMISPPPDIIEPLIAVSIFMLAIENIYSSRIKPWRMLMIFLFGLVHGMGFAGALSELGLPDYSFVTALLSFNVGVEMGQLLVILLMYLFVAKLFSEKSWYRWRVVIPANIAIAIVALFWTYERVFITT